MFEQHDIYIEEPHYRDILNGDKTVESRAKGPNKDYDQITEGDILKFIPVDKSSQEFSWDELHSDLPAQPLYTVGRVEFYDRGNLTFEEAVEVNEPLNTFLEKKVLRMFFLESLKNQILRDRQLLKSITIYLTILCAFLSTEFLRLN